MRDFTISMYECLIHVLIQRKIPFFTVYDMFSKAPSKFMVLRHDVDLLPDNSLQFAMIQAKLGIKGTYYFRTVKKSWDEHKIRQINDLGHEIGYHYETMDKANGNIKKAWDMFRKDLDILRTLADVKTICMHGSPASNYDNKDLWSKYDYKDVGIIGEPYLDINFDDVFYLTDTGRCWDGYRFSIRDKVPQQENWVKSGLTFNKTQQLIEKINKGFFPYKTMFTMHPQRWTNNKMKWTKELVLQNLKNSIKKLMVK